MNMVKPGDDIPVPFLDIPLVDLSIQWGALFDGKIVGEIELRKPTVNFAADSTSDTQTGTVADWTQPIKELMPLQINRFTAVDGVVPYKDFGSDPKVDLRLDSLQIQATNLRNTEGLSGTLPSNISASAKSIGGGILEMNADMNILKEIPDFDLSAEFEGIYLPDPNDFAEAYAELDFKSGIFNLYTEMAVSDGKLEGYVKPVMTDMQVFDISEDHKKPLESLWEGVAGFFTTIFQNHPRDQFATQVPFEDNLNEPDTQIWPAIGGIFRNAFIEAFSKDVEHTVSFKEVVQEKNQ